METLNRREFLAAAPAAVLSLLPLNMDLGPRELPARLRRLRLEPIPPSLAELVQRS
jgi:hypothetical protein